jgi:D-alanyl-D-alanine carboxypeptidase (penicillin-binding protein 5/6)
MRFTNATGLDVEGETLGGAYGSAHDVAMLLAYILKHHPDLIAATREPRLSVTALGGITHHIENTNVIAEDIPWLIGSKTGFTDLAGGNLAIVFDVGFSHPVVAVVLGSTKEERFSDIQEVVSTTFAYFESNAAATSTLDGEL